MNPTRSLFAGLAIVLSIALPSRAQTADDFDPDSNGTVNAFAIQPNGQTLIGGQFSIISGQSRNNIARLNADGSLDTSFDPNVSGPVFSMALQTDGRILVGGSFYTVGGMTQKDIARLNADGSIDSSFAGFNWYSGRFSVHSIAVQADGRILAGGKGLWRLNVDGSHDSDFAPTPSGWDPSVFTLAVQMDGKILVGGGFVWICGQQRNRIARLNTDGSLDTSFNPNADSFVNSIVLQPDGKILVGGQFFNIYEQTRRGIARLNDDGSLDSEFIDSNANSYGVEALALQADGKIVVGGWFNNMTGQTRNRIARLNTDGSLDANFNPNIGGGSDPYVRFLASQTDGKILVGGLFTSIGGQTRNHIGRLTNNTPASSALSVSGTSQIDWTRGGSAPELNQVIFASWDGNAWTSLGNGTRVSGGWRLTGLNLPNIGQIRARGISGSSSVIEQISNYSLPFASYSAWVAANAPGQSSDQDHDQDGVANGIEYFMGKTGNDFTANPGIVDGMITWPKNPAFSGSYAVQTSADLVEWTDVTDDAAQVTKNTYSVIWRRPTGAETRFVRLLVTPN